MTKKNKGTIEKKEFNRLTALAKHANTNKRK
jgi:hypothetical protein